MVGRVALRVAIGGLMVRMTNSSDDNSNSP